MTLLTTGILLPDINEVIDFAVTTGRMSAFAAPTQVAQDIAVRGDGFPGYATMRVEVHHDIVTRFEVTVTFVVTCLNSCLNSITARLASALDIFVTLRRRYHNAYLNTS